MMMNIPLPSVKLEEIELSQKENELIINAGMIKKVLLLPDILANKSVEKARFENGVLRIEFSCVCREIFKN